ncbi:hypothetical protein CHU92_07230 [Flavobacterium cyanobacteriorum]|uniref:YdbS-like PH domain-containing protein n=2 Tax=Flavobacterium cyanobacteriorum TaxID=2022802 RepID=A0A255Z8S0_9FLAO|nr:hypothetical protein CHU92_07230 [Flavobacterium cyanobacteriorum]
MEDFINEAIDTTSLPRFEEVRLKPLHPEYKKIMWFNFGLTFILTGIACTLVFYFIEETRPYIIPAAVAYISLLLFSAFIAMLSFRNRGFAFRTHDIVYRSGAIGITTAIIPYNRVQHVALHEGWLARRLGLASIEIFTAGGISSDIKIPGIEKIHAENIKQLLIGKIQNEVSDEG